MAWALRVPSSVFWSIDVVAVINPQEVVVGLHAETTEIQVDGRLLRTTDDPNLSFVVAIVPMVETAFRAFQDGDGRAFVDEFVVIVPVPIRSWVSVRLVGIMLMSAYFGAGILAAKVVDAGVEACAIVQGVAIEGAMTADDIITATDAAHQVGGGLVHRLGEETRDVAVSLMFDADGVAIGSARVPSLVGLAHHLRHLPVDGSDDIMG